MGVVVSFMALPLGVGRKGSPHPKFSGFINNGRGYFGGRGIAHLPSSSHSRDALLPRLRGLRRRKDWHLSLPPQTVGVYFMYMAGNNDELNILHSQTYRAVPVEGDRAVFLRFSRS